MSSDKEKKEDPALQQLTQLFQEFMEAREDLLLKQNAAMTAEKNFFTAAAKAKGFSKAMKEATAKAPRRHKLEWSIEELNTANKHQHETDEEIGKALGMPATKVEGLRKLYASAHLDFMSKVTEEDVQRGLKRPEHAPPGLDDVVAQHEAKRKQRKTEGGAKPTGTPSKAAGSDEEDSEKSDEDEEESPPPKKTEKKSPPKPQKKVESPKKSATKEPPKKQSSSASSSEPSSESSSDQSD